MNKTDVNEYLDNKANYQEKTDFLEYMSMIPATLQLTIGVSEDGKKWGYQTGDNSVTGGAYGFPHWAVVDIFYDSDLDYLKRDIRYQILDLIGSFPKIYDVFEWLDLSFDSFIETVESRIDEQVAQWQSDSGSDYQDAANYLSEDIAEMRT